MAQLKGLTLDTVLDKPAPPYPLPTHPAAWKVFTQILPIVEPELPLGRAGRYAFHHVVEIPVAGLYRFKFYPHWSDLNGKPHVLFYVAYNETAKRAELAVPATDLSAFRKYGTHYVMAAGNFFGVFGNPTQHEIESGRMVHEIMRGNLRAGVRALGRAWVAALKNPTWYMEAVPATAVGVSAMGVRSRVANRMAAQSRLVRTQTDLLSNAAKRKVAVLERPTAYRHTLTADVPMASYARIEKQGRLLNSSGAKAHYGSGVYAWKKNAKGVGKYYIDIEVAAGTAVEEITTRSGQVFYRLIAAKGDAVHVKIVGSSLTAEQVALGRRLVSQ